MIFDPVSKNVCKVVCMKEEKTLYPLSHPQRRIWYSEKLHPGTSMWNIAGTLKIKGKLNLEYIEKAVLAFIEKNDTIRLRITEVNGVPFQYIAPFTDQRIDVIDFSSSGLRQLFEWDQAQTAAPMTMLDSCLYYFAIIKLPGGKGALYAKVHHIMSDGFSPGPGFRHSDRQLPCAALGRTSTRTCRDRISITSTTNGSIWNQSVLSWTGSSGTGVSNPRPSPPC